MTRGGKFRGKRRGGKVRRKQRSRFHSKKHGGRLAKFRSVIKQLKHLKPPQRVKAMKVANNKFIKHMCGEVRRLQYKPLPTPIQNRMKQNARKIRKLINRKTSMLAKRRMLTQRGGFLPLLLGALAAPIVGPLVGRVARNLLR